MASQYAWPYTKNPFLPVSAWTTGPGPVQINQPGCFISLEENLCVGPLSLGKLLTVL